MDEQNAHSIKHLHLSIDDPQYLCQVTRALSNPVRLQILQLLGKKSLLSVNDLADILNVPVSTVSLAISTLEEAGLIFTENMPGVRGVLKLSTRKIDSIGINLMPFEKHMGSVLSMQMPVGCYSKVGSIMPSCGLTGVSSSIGENDNPRSFYHNDRFSAQLIWFRQGFVEYMFGIQNIDEIAVDWLELSFEACSEAPMYRDPWKSDIYVSINGRNLGMWTSPCDCGEHRGKLNPAWWPDLATQHGFLKTWRVDEKGCYLDSLPISGTTLNDLHLDAGDAVTVRIEAPDHAVNAGGLNLFGDQFGDFPQSIMLRIGYHMKEIVRNK